MKRLKYLSFLLLFSVFAVPQINAETICDETAVTIDGVEKCQTLTNAVANVDEGGKITLQKDQTVSSRIDIDKTITIDLNGHKIISTVADNAPIRVSGGNLTITGEGAIVASANGTALLVEEQRTGKGSAKTSLTVESGVVLEGNKTATVGLMVDALDDDDQKTSKNSANDVTVNFKGKIQNFASFGVYVNGRIKNGNAPEVNLTGATIGTEGSDPADVKFGIYQAGNSVFNVENTTINAGTGIAVKNGTLNLTNSTINATDSYTAATNTNGGVGSTGDAIFVESNDNYGEVTLNINGGKYTSENGYAVQEYSSSTTKLKSAKITDGTFDGKGKGAINTSSDFQSNGPKQFIEGGQFLQNGEKSEVKDYVVDTVVEGPDGTVGKMVKITSTEGYNLHAAKVKLIRDTYTGVGKSVKAVQGQDMSFEITPNAHYQVKAVYITDTENAEEATQRIDAVFDPETTSKGTLKAPTDIDQMYLHIEYEEIQYGLSIEYYLDGEKVEETAAGSAVIKSAEGEVITSAAYHQTVTVEVTTNEGYTFEKIADVRGDEKTAGSELKFTQTGHDAVVKVYFKAKQNTITISNLIQNGTITTNPGKRAGTGSEVTITSKPTAGYALVEVIVKNKTTGQRIDVTPVEGNANEYTFTMPAADVTIEATYGKLYNVTKGSGIVDGTIEVEEGQYTAGTQITVTATPSKEGYVVEKIVYIYGGEEHEAELNGNVGTFTMPESDVVISANFIKEEVKEEEKTYPITEEVQGETHGTVEVKNAEKAGNTVTVTVTPEEGYEVDTIKVFKVNTSGIMVMALEPNEIPVSVEGNVGTFTMPNSAVKIVVTYKKKATEPTPEEKTEYTVTTEATENGSFTVSAEKATEGTEITVSATPVDGYELDTIVVTDANGENIEVVDGKFTMPAANVTVKVTFKKTNTEPAPVDPAPATKYSITVGESENGTVTVDPKEAEKGTEVTVTAEAKAGYKLDKVVYIVEGSDEEVAIENGKFVMPEGNVTVKAYFTEGQQSGEEEQPGGNQGEEVTDPDNQGTGSTPENPGTSGEEEQPSENQGTNAPITDNTATENPQTYVSIFGTVALLVASVGVLGFAVKKYLTR